MEWFERFDGNAAAAVFATFAIAGLLGIACIAVRLALHWRASFLKIRERHDALEEQNRKLRGIIADREHANLAEQVRDEVDGADPVPVPKRTLH